MNVGEGTISILAKDIYHNVQMCDEILNSKRIFTMFCSSKLCRWSYVGLKGEENTFIFKLYVCLIEKTPY